jgi:DNA-binding NarL/FixJ family response regulator
MKVLIADSSAVVVDRLITMMEEIPNVEVLAPARSAPAILESIRRHDPEALIVDVRFPGAKGTDLLQTIRQAKPNAVLIVLTDLAYPEYRKRLEALGADLCMDKSREFTHLLQLVGELARNSFDGKGPASKRGMRKQLATSKLRVGLGH